MKELEAGGDERGPGSRNALFVWLRVADGDYCVKEKINSRQVWALIKEVPVRVLQRNFITSDISPRASCTGKVKPTEEVFNQAITSAGSK